MKASVARWVSTAREGLRSPIPAMLLLVVGLVSSSYAAIDAYPFEDPATEARFRQLTEELRCPKCQNQNIADSDAPIAADLRHKVYELLNSGKSDADVVDYLVQRYGDFVTYRPPMNALTAALWFGPLVLIAGVAVLLLIWVKRRNRSASVDELAAAERVRLEQILRAADE